MVASTNNDDNAKPEDAHRFPQLTDEQLQEVRDCWGMGVPLRILARQHDVTENELRLQLGQPMVKPALQPPIEACGIVGPKERTQMIERRRQLAALESRFGVRHDG